MSATIITPDSTLAATLRAIESAVSRMPFECPYCGGEGGESDGDGINEPNTHTACAACGATGNLLFAVLERSNRHMVRIATALEIIASDITERRAQDRRGLIARHEQLRLDVNRAAFNRDRAQAAGDEYDTEFWREALRDAESELRWFESTYPDIATAVPS